MSAFGLSEYSVFSQHKAHDIIPELLDYRSNKRVKTSYLVEGVVKLYKTTKDPLEKMKFITPIKHFCLEILRANLPFNQAHIVFLKIVIETRSYHQAVDLLQCPFVRTGELGPDEILQYLYYSGIIWTVLEKYKSAVECFEILNRIETKETNLKSQNLKKLNLLKLLLGDTVSASQQSIEYQPIIQKLYKNQELTREEEETIKKDGNIQLIRKLKNSLTLADLSEISLLYNRVSINTLNPIYALPKTISQINKIRHTYRYDPRSECLIFEDEKKNVEKAISKTVKSYFAIAAEEAENRTRSLERERGGGRSGYGSRF